MEVTKIGGWGGWGGKRGTVKEKGRSCETVTGIKVSDREEAKWDKKIEESMLACLG